MFDFQSVVSGHAALLHLLESTASIDSGNVKIAKNVRCGIGHLIKCSYNKIDGANPLDGNQAEQKINLLSSEQANYFMGIQKCERALAKARHQACSLS